MEKKILIIGGLGYIGSVLYPLMQNEKWSTKIFDNHLYKDLEPVHPYIDGDIRNIKQLEDNIKNFDVVVNLAAIVGNPGCLVDTEIAIDINCIGARNIAEICKKYDKRIVQISTCSIYGSETDRVVKETDLAFPVDFYGQNKYHQERVIRETCIENCCVLRLGTVYGSSPRMRYDLVINLFTGKAINQGRIVVFGGTQRRPFVHIKDVCRAIIHVIKNNLHGIYNVPGSNIDMLGVAKIVREVTNCKIDIKEDITDKRSYYADGTKLKNTGFKFTYTIKDGVEEISHSSTVKHMIEPIYSNYLLCEFLYLSKTLKDKNPKLTDLKSINKENHNVTIIDFGVYGVKSYEVLSGFRISTILAWYIHKLQAKYFFIRKGAARFFTVKVKNIQNPDKNQEILNFKLLENKPEILFIPSNFAYGIKILEPDTEIWSFSTFNFTESEKDKYKLPKAYWGERIWV